MDTRTVNELAQEALVVQDACNLSGVVHAWSRSISRLRELFPNEGTRFFNRHPINVLFVDKVEDLTGRGGFEELNTAYDAVKDLANRSDKP